MVLANSEFWSVSL